MRDFFQYESYLAGSARTTDGIKTARADKPDRAVVKCIALGVVFMYGLEGAMLENR